VVGGDQQGTVLALDRLGDAAEPVSTVSTALIAADSTPVWPTMSGLA